MVLLFAHQNSPRLHYLIEEVFSRRLGMTITLTHQFDDFLSASATKKIAYTPTPIDVAGDNQPLWVHQSELIFESFVRDFAYEPTMQTFSVSQLKASDTCPFQTISGLFPCKSSASLDDQHIPFDLFSAIFWCLTRYEEVQWGLVQGTPSASKGLSADPHGRYPAAQSLLYRLKCLDTPIVDQWVWLLGYLLDAQPNKSFQIIPTADIDMALRFGGRSWYLQAAGMVRDLVKSPSLVLDRIAVWFGKKDPYAMDQGTLQILGNYGQEAAPYSPKLFLLGATPRSKRNKQISQHAINAELERLKKPLFGSTALMGIHPSWQEKNNALKTLTAWRNEYETFESSLGFKPKDARLHFIHLHLPHTYQLLTQLNIENDWSMGYPDAVGFRAGTSIPFKWYDITQERATDLQIFPFCIMDVTCKNYLKLSDEESIVLGDQLKQTIQALGGVFCFIFHNESVSEKLPWKGWKNSILSWATPLAENHNDIPHIEDRPHQS